GGDGSDEGCDPADRSESSADEFSNGGGVDRSRAMGAADGSDAAGRVWIASAGAGDHWDLWSDGALGGAADVGDRGTDVAGGEQGADSEADSGARDADYDDRSGDRRGRIFVPGTVDGATPVWSESAGSADGGRSDGVAGGGGVAGVLCAGAASDAGGSDYCV